MSTVPAKAKAVVIGEAGVGLAGVVREYGASVLHVATREGLTDYTPTASGRALSQLVEKLKPVAVLSAGSPRVVTRTAKPSSLSIQIPTHPFWRMQITQSSAIFIKLFPHSLPQSKQTRDNKR